MFLLPPNFPVFRHCLWDNYSCVTLTLIKNSLSCNEISMSSCIKIQSIHLDPPPTWYADNVENISSYSKYLEGLDQFSFTSDIQLEKTFSQKSFITLYGSYRVQWTLE